MSNAPSASEDATLFCDRCARRLLPGQADFFVVRIEAVADPTPPAFTEADLQRDARGAWEAICRELEQFSEQELRDQVYRRLCLYLCNACFRKWIEKPLG